MAAKTYDEAAVLEQLRPLPGWYYDNGAIARAFKTDGWPVTLMLVNAIGFVAEAADHHPDLSVSYSRVVVTLNTHSAGGVTDQDFELARRIEDLALWRPPAGSALTGTSGAFVQSGEPRR